MRRQMHSVTTRATQRYVSNAAVLREDEEKEKEGDASAAAAAIALVDDKEARSGLAAGPGAAVAARSVTTRKNAPESNSLAPKRNEKARCTETPLEQEEEEEGRGGGGIGKCRERRAEEKR